MLGFPSHAPGHTYSIEDSKITQLYTTHGVQKFEIDKLIRKGNSGGPIINKEGKVVGVAQKGVTEQTGHNECLKISEIHEVIKNEEYKINI